MRLLVLAALFGSGLVTGCDNGNGGPDAGDADTQPCQIEVEGECVAQGQACVESPNCCCGLICISHVCETIYNRVYEVDVLNASIYARGPGGACWDGEAPGCLDPDPYAKVQIGDVTHQTEVVDDNLFPIWEDATFEARVEERTLYGVWIYDDDSGEDGEDDEVLKMEPFFWLTEDNLRNGWVYVVEKHGSAETRLDLIFSPKQE